jgi:hypothetical protein
LDLITRLHNRGSYFLDSWRASPHLTLNYGLRWDITPPWYEQRNELGTITPGEQSVVLPGAPKVWVVPGDPGVPSSMGWTRYHDFAPRIGLAWALWAASGFLLQAPGRPRRSQRPSRLRHLLHIL